MGTPQNWKKIIKVVRHRLDGISSKSPYHTCTNVAYSNHQMIWPSCPFLALDATTVPVDFILQAHKNPPKTLLFISRTEDTGNTWTREFIE